jgi:hypothetical protein
MDKRKPKILGSLTAVALVFGLATQAHADLIVGDGNYIGSIVDGIPSNETLEADYVNSLLFLGAGVGDTPCEYAASEVCNTQGGIDTTGFADATGGDKTDTNVNTGIDVTGYTYILGKYDAGQAGSFVWYVGNLSGLENIPATINGFGLSHYTLFGGPRLDTPEPATLGLLGLGLLGAGFARRRRMR